MRIDVCLQTRAAQLAALSDTAVLDAQLLLAHVLKVSTTYFYTWPDAQLTPPQLAEFDGLMAQRIQGKPIAYILGSQAFWTFEVDVAACTLIPRADTERLVEIALQLLEGCANPKVLDLGTGTGAVALAIASERKDAQVQAVDLIDQAVLLAQNNAQKLGLAVDVYQSSWFDQVKPQSFDLIVSNPPYIDPDDAHLQQGDVRYEPSSALVAQEQGYSDIKTIADQARAFLTAGGWLAFEHGFEQGAISRQILAEYGYQAIQTQQDYGHNDRVTLGQYSPV